MPDLESILITELEAGTGIEFARDAWIDENNDMGRRDYGVVTLDGSPLSLWGDDRLVYQRIGGSVILYVMDGDDEKAQAAQNVLRGLDVAFRLVSCEFDRDQPARRWTWSYTMEKYFRAVEAPETPEEPVMPEEPDTEPDGG